jgi:uncharacterized C2H2 Zn-finger protein
MSGYFKEIMGNNGNEKVAVFFRCESCDYNTSKRSNYDKHVLTAKHQKATFGSILEINGNESICGDENFDCKKCGQHYKTGSGLWKHSKKCSQIKDKTKFLLDIIKNDEQIKAFLMEQNKQIIAQNAKLIEIAQNTNSTTHVNSNNNNTINSNNKFSINLFLNETCKNAINLTDFVNQISLSISDLESTSRLGYAEGISKVFIDNLNEINLTTRPIHCSDAKREILYIKDNNEWTKDNDSKDKLTNAIKIVDNKNIKQIPEWQKANPEYMNPDSKQNDKYMKMICEVMSGSSKEEQQKNYNKIIKNIVKEVIIDKEFT